MTEGCYMTEGGTSKLTVIKDNFIFFFLVG